MDREEEIDREVQKFADETKQTIRRIASERVLTYDEVHAKFVSALLHLRDRETVDQWVAREREKK